MYRFNLDELMDSYATVRSCCTSPAHFFSVKIENGNISVF